MAEDDDRDRGDSRPHGEDAEDCADAEDYADTEDRSDAEGGPDAEDPEVVDAAFDALADERRRLVLYYLRDRESADLGELATVVSGWQQARAPEAGRVTPDDRDRVRISLHHVHLPQLVDAGVVRYDTDTREVALDGVPDVLDSVLERSLADDRRGVEPFGRGRGPNEDRGESSDDGESTGDGGSSDDERSTDGGDRGSTGDDDCGSTGDGSESGGDGT